MEVICKQTPKRVAVVTGANKGIGLEIVRQLASIGVMVLLTARDVKRGTAAAEKLKDDGFADGQVVFHQLDVADPAGVVALAEFIKIQFGKLDILVNNAGMDGLIFPNREDFKSSTEEKSEEAEVTRLFKLIASSIALPNNAEECLNVNYYGTKRVTEELIPLLQLSDSPRIVNVSSIFGNSNIITNERIKKKLSDVNAMPEEELDELVQEFLKDFKEGKLEENGWPTKVAAYAVSKLAINAYTRILAKRFPAFCINSVHPGFVSTDLTSGIGLLTPEEGARAPVMLALLPDGGPTGCFYEELKLSSFQKSDTVI